MPFLRSEAIHYLFRSFRFSQSIDAFSFQCDWKSFEQQMHKLCWILFCYSCEKSDRTIGNGWRGDESEERMSGAYEERVWIDWSGVADGWLFNAAIDTIIYAKEPKSTLHQPPPSSSNCIFELAFLVCLHEMNGELRCFCEDWECNQYRWMCRIPTKCQEQHTY